ncbi:hypothetical protein MTO96_017261 [Rhipicephalus appendiculatus]
MSTKEVCVVGAGPSGLACARQMLDYGFHVVLHERSSELGGLWVYHDYDVEGRASVMRTTIMNTSKEMSASSDFPPPKDLPNFMHNTEMLNYFRSYADHFGVTKHVKTRHDVVQVTPATDYEKTGRWDVLVRDLETNTDHTETFDAVAVCVGHHVYPNVPRFKGQEKFRGRIVHTHSLKNADSFRNHRVAVVGIGNSGGDAVVDVSHVALKTYLSTRRGAWVSRRVGPNGMPIDIFIKTRLRAYLMSLLPDSLANGYMENFLNRFFNHEAYGLKPMHRYNAQHPTTNDVLPSLILSGKVRVKKNIAEFTEDGVIFEELLFNKRFLPSEEAMFENIRKKRESMRRRYVASPRHTIQEDWIRYMDELASQIGARPNILKYFFTDNELFRALLGPCVPYQFRLEGPHPWSGARQAIIESRRRVMYPLNDRCTSFSKKGPSAYLYMILFFSVLAVRIRPFLDNDSFPSCSSRPRS